MGHLEVERKYDVPAGFVVPTVLSKLSARGVALADAGSERRLDALYFDTAEFHLARRGVTLRRRTGGDDDGWHLKRPAGKNSRTELTAPLDDSVAEPPDAFGNELWALTRGSALRPVLRLLTRRVEHPVRSSEGVTLAVLADDQVAAQTPDARRVLRRWREVEVELVDGPDDLLRVVERALLDAGAREAKASSKLARALRGQLPRGGSSHGAWDTVADYAREQRDAIVALDPGVRRDDEDAIHQMRVACRRLRSTLRTFRPMFGIDRAEPLRGELRWLAGELGPARDSEVMAARLQAALAEEPAELVVGPVARQISVSFSTQHAQARDRLLAALTSERYAALLERLDEVVDGPPVTTVTKAALCRRARKAVHRVTARLDLAERLADAPSAGARVTPPLPGVTPDRDTALHDARKAAKRARYAAEALRPFGGKDARRLVKRFKHLQEVLGVHQDSIITRQVLRDQGMRAYLDGQNSFTYGLLHAKQELAGEMSLAELGAARKAVGKKATSWLR